MSVFISTTCSGMHHALGFPFLSQTPTTDCNMIFVAKTSAAEGQSGSVLLIHSIPLGVTFLTRLRYFFGNYANLRMRDPRNFPRQYMSYEVRYQVHFHFIIRYRHFPLTLIVQVISERRRGIFALTFLFLDVRRWWRKWIPRQMQTLSTMRIATGASPVVVRGCN